MNRLKNLVFWAIAIFTSLLLCSAVVLLVWMFSRPPNSLGDLRYVPELAVYFLWAGVESIWKLPEIGIPGAVFVISYVAAPVFCAKTDFEKRWAKYVVVGSALALLLFPVAVLTPALAGLVGPGAGH